MRSSARRWPARRRARRLPHRCCRARVHRFRVTKQRPPAGASRSAAPQPAADASCRLALSSRCRRSRLPRPLSPSRRLVLDRRRDRAGRFDAFAGARRRRGAVIRHRARPGDPRLLQILPGLPEDEREAAAQRYLGRVGAPGWPERARRRAGLRSMRSSTIRLSRRCSRADRAPKWRSWARSTIARRAARRLRQDRPAGGDRERGADRRLQDQPAGAGALEEVPQAYVAAACALPRAAPAALSRQDSVAPRCCSPKRRA